MATQDPDLADVIDAAIANHMESHWTALPATIASYDASTQTCSAQPQVRVGYAGEDGERAAERLPVITSIPVLFPSGGAFRVTFPVQAGDPCLLIFSSVSLEKWQSLGEEADSGDDTRRNTLAHAFAFVGARAPVSALKSAPTDMMTMGKDDGLVIEIDDDEIRIGGAAAGFVVLASPYRTREDAMVNALLGVINALATMHAPAGTYPDAGTASACSAAVTAINAFISNAASYVTQFGKVW